MVKDKKDINIKARRERLKRIILNSEKKVFNLSFFDGFRITKSYFFVVLFIIFIIPVYPSLSSIAYNNTQYDFLRNDIDESSILGSFYSDIDENYSNNPILESSDSFLSINNILNDERDLAGTNEIVEYEIQPGDNISSIAYNFKVSNNSIYWANNFDKNHVIQPGDIIKIPPVSGLIHQVVSGDSISTIAKKYNVESDKIIEQNLISLNDELIIGDILVIPGAEKQIVKPVFKPVTTVYKKTTANTSNTSYGFNSSIVTEQGSYKLVRRQPQHTFYWGNCTRYVAQYKNVNWGGNANQWIKNASSAGHKTGKTPSLGSIVVFDGRGYNPRYGHVGIVMDIKGSNIIVSDMNYRRLNEITYRKVPISDRAIQGYIYVD